MPIPNSEYWAQRFKIMENAIQNKSLDYANNLEKQFNSAAKEIDDKIRAWYQRFAKNNKISFAEAQKQLTKGELKEFKWTVWEYIEKGKESAISGAWAKELENASARVHISRLEALKIQLQQQAEELAAVRIATTEKAAENAYTGSYYHTAFEIQKGLGVGCTMEALNKSKVEKILSRPWTTDNRTFTARCWTDKNKLVQLVNQELTRMAATGAGPDKAIETIAKQLNVSARDAARVVMTESAAFATAAQHDCFNDLDVEQFQIVGTFDKKKTCGLCGDLNGKVFPMSEFREGETAPPFHPWCRCCTAPYFADMEGIGKRWSRNPDTGKGELLPVDTKFSDWKAKYVKPKAGGEKKFNLPTAENAQYSKSPRINSDNEAKFIRTPNGMEPFEITACHADGTNNNIFISSNAKEFMKPKDIHELDRRFTEAFKILNAQNSVGHPKICVASVDEIATDAIAAYNVIDNTIFINERIFHLPTGNFACPDNKLSTILHECIHWKDAVAYRARFGEITKQNYRTEYLPFIYEKSKKALDKLKEKGYNIEEISDYALRCIMDGSLDEVYTEYRVKNILKE